jgi:hypothetical protein
MLTKKKQRQLWKNMTSASVDIDESFKAFGPHVHRKSFTFDTQF